MHVCTCCAMQLCSHLILACKGPGQTTVTPCHYLHYADKRCWGCSTTGVRGCTGVLMGWGKYSTTEVRGLGPVGHVFCREEGRLRQYRSEGVKCWGGFSTGTERHQGGGLKCKRNILCCNSLLNFSIRFQCYAVKRILQTAVTA